MTELWSPEANRSILGSDAGPFTGGAPKFLLHTTESSNFSSALSVFRTKGYWPNATATFETGSFTLYQHLAINRSAKALEHPSGTGATNTDNVVQIECVGFSAQADKFPDEYLAGIARFMAFVSQNNNVPLVAPYPFGLGAPRVSWPQWHNTPGIYGHCHCPANSHHDPGSINVPKLLQLAIGGTVTPAPGLPNNIVREYRLNNGGKWKVAADGGVFATDGAPFFGSMGGQMLAAPIISIIATTDEGGYWLVGADGGIFAFGNAKAIAPYQPLFEQYHSGQRHVVDAVKTPSGLELLSNLGENYDLN